MPSRTQSRKEGMAVTIVDTSRPVTGGVDTHLDVHVAAALDGIGGLLGVEHFDTTVAGNKALLEWLKTFGTPMRVGVEGTGSYGAGLARYLRRAGVEVLEVDRRIRARNATRKNPPEVEEILRRGREQLHARLDAIQKQKASDQQVDGHTG